MLVIKRDGSRQSFNVLKIIDAIFKASRDVGVVPVAEDVQHIALRIEQKLLNEKEVGVDDIHSAVETALMGSKYKDVARAYIERRSFRDKQREANGKLFKEVDSFINQTSDEFIKENANKAATVVSTHRDLLAGIMSKHIATTQLLDKTVAKAHTSGAIHVHDLDYYLSPLTNCLLVGYEDMMSNGFKLGDAEIETPKSIGTAATILTQICQAVASATYGGQTHAHIDSGLKPYVEASYNKLKEKQKKWNLPDVWAEEELAKEVYDAMQSLLYQIQTLTTTNGQSPFVTLTFGLDTSKFGRLITEQYLKVHINGVGKNKATPVFPKVVFFLEDGINTKEGDPNYDLKKLAVECSTKRIYPDYVNVSKNREITGVKTVPVSPMGCVDGQEVVTYKYNEKLYVQSFERMWEHFSSEFEVKKQPNGTDEFIDMIGVEIFDSNKDSFVNTSRLIRNFSNDWYKVKMKGGRTLLCTGDHPLPTQDGRKFVKDMVVGDIVPITSKQFAEDTVEMDADHAWLLGVVLCDGCYPDTLRVSIAAVGEDDIEQKIYLTAKKFYDLDMKTILQLRGGTTQYKDVVCFGGSKGIHKIFADKFGGKQKKYRHFPQDAFSWGEEARMSFLAGMVDADGYVNDTGSGFARVQVGSTNKELAIQQMLLANSLGLDAKMYENKYNKAKPNAIRYLVEFNAVDSFISKMVCEKKKVKIKYPDQTRDFKGLGTVYAIDRIDLEQYSYDVTTDSDRFDVTGINSHNCRSYLSAWKDNDGNEKLNQRFNLGVVSTNLPYIALEAKRDNKDFYEVFDKYLDLCYKAHMDRVERLKGTKAKQNPVMWMNGAVARLQPEDTIDHLFYGGYASISIGYIGLWECCNILTDNLPKEKAIEILSHLKSRCEEYKVRSNIGFSPYGTPSESYCHKAAKAVKREFGEHSVSRDYLTNSFHMPVWEESHPSEKWGYELGFAEISTGGNISYVEVPNLVRNPEAYEGLLDYACSIGMHYFALNTPVDQCYQCGYHGEFTATLDGYYCPECGNTDQRTMSVLRRVSGYISSPSLRPYNKGKQQECTERVKHMKFK